MKKVFLTATVLAGFTFAANAQYARFGVKAGVNISNTPLETSVSNLKNEIGFGAYGGGLVEFSFKKRSDKFKLQIEANYNLTQLKHGFNYFKEDVVGTTTLHAINIPILAKYFFKPRFSLYAGPTANINVGSSYKMDAFVNDPNYELNTFQFGGMIGANYYIKKGFFVEARYHAIMPDVYTSRLDPRFGLAPDYGIIHNFQVGLGYKF